MIGSLRGVLLERWSDGEVLVEVAGVGYRVTVAPATSVDLGETGREVFLHIHHHRREDAETLYGFLRADERLAFEALLGAHGVGPSLALAILSVHPPAALQRVLAADDLDALCLVPGVGKKTAARLLVELKSRLDVPGLDAAAVAGSQGVEGAAAGHVSSGRRPRCAHEPRLRARRGHHRAARAARRRRSVGAVAGGAATTGGGLMRDEILSPEPGPEDLAHEPDLDATPGAGDLIGEEGGLRPRSLDDFVGQRELKEHLQIILEAARRRGQAVDHLLFAGPPGLGKTTLAGIVAGEQGVALHVTSGPALDRAGDLAAILTRLGEGDVLFIDEIHRLSRTVEEVLYPGMEDFQLDIVLGKGPAARSIRLDLPRFTLVGATTRTGLITGPLARSLRSGRPARLLRRRRARVHRHPGGRHPGARCRPRRRRGDRPPGTGHASHRQPAPAPRARLRRGARRRAWSTATSPAPASRCSGSTSSGSTRSTARCCPTSVRKFGGGPVGLGTLAISVGEAEETVEDVYEPFLIQQGLLMRTPRGRVATPAAWAHVGLIPPAGAPLAAADPGPSLFGD